MTADGRTLQNSESLRRSSAGIGRSARTSRMSGWMPIWRSAETECCVGLVFSSPADGMYGISVRWMKTASPRGRSFFKLADRLEERQAFDVADRAADLDQHEVVVRRCRRGRTS